MTQEHWQQIQALYDAVQNHPAQSEALLSGVDEKVRREVNALLASPAADAATGTMTQLRVSDAMLQLGPYRVLACIGRGGMGHVFRGLDTRLDRPVAIKTSDDRFSDRFEREARAISLLNHPHICTLYDGNCSGSR
jgi:serine/threonine protein kinase